VVKRIKIAAILNLRFNNTSVKNKKLLDESFRFTNIKYLSLVIEVANFLEKRGFIVFRGVLY
jgi:hypothetical protein